MPSTLTPEESKHVSAVYSQISPIMMAEFAQDPRGFMKGYALLVATLASLIQSNNLGTDNTEEFLADFTRNVIAFIEGLDEND
jgi:hypothetical protein